MDLRKIKKLIALLEEKNITEIEIKEGDQQIRLTRKSTNDPATVIHMPNLPTPAVALESSTKAVSLVSGHRVCSPMVGTLYLAASPESTAFVQIGQSVKIGDTLCIIEAMKMFNEIEADRAGVIAEILVNNGDPVEYNQALFVILE